MHIQLCKVRKKNGAEKKIWAEKKKMGPKKKFGPKKKKWAETTHQFGRNDPTPKLGRNDPGRNDPAETTQDRNDPGSETV